MNEQLCGFGETAVNAAVVLGFSDRDWYLCTVYVDVMEIIKKTHCFDMVYYTEKNLSLCGLLNCPRGGK